MALELDFLRQFTKILLWFHSGKRICLLKQRKSMKFFIRIKELAPEHSAQLINYLKASAKKVGLLINFGKRKIQYKRLYHPDYYPVAGGDPAYHDK